MTRSSDPGSLVEPARETEIRHETEVLVVGGGAAGVAAAVAAARAGADVMLVERQGYLGGLATGGLIILLLTPDDMLEEAGARALLHAWACEPLIEDGRVVAVTLQSKAGRFAVRARIVIDATGDGDLFAAAGCSHETARVPPWMWFTVGGVDVDRAIEAGAGCFQTLGAGKVLFPWGATEKIGRIDATLPEDLTRAEVECRRRVLAEFEGLRRDVPGLADSHLCQVADQLGITESRRLVGRSVLTRKQMDIATDDTVAVTGHWTRYGAVYHVPFGALLPRELPNLLVAGRCISVDSQVHQATKEIPACMATGEAAGTAAALSVRAGLDPPALDLERLRSTLAAGGAIVALDPPQPS